MSPADNAEHVMKPTAEWTDDCCGKKDYDGDVLSISTRYWDDHSAASMLIVRFKDKDGVDDYFELTRAEFEGDSFAQTAVQVEAWAQEQYTKAVEALRACFQVPK